jgi:hypothetical protein
MCSKEKCLTEFYVSENIRQRARFGWSSDPELCAPRLLNVFNLANSRAMIAALNLHKEKPLMNRDGTRNSTHLQPT